MTVLAWPKYGKNTYNKILYEQMEKRGVVVLSHRDNRLAGMLCRVNVFHFHWINAFLNKSYLKALFSTILFIIYATVLKINKAKIVWTLHNTKQYTHHERNKSLEKILIKFLFIIVDSVILHSSFQLDHINNKIRRKAVVVPHHNYCKELDEMEYERSYYLFFGRVAKYKGLEDAIIAFKKLPLGKLKNNFKIVGAFDTIEYKEEILKLVDGFENIIIEDRFVDDQELEIIVKKAKVVMLPYKRITNSGSLIYALSCRTPVIIKKSELTEELLDEYPELSKIILTYENNSQLLNILENDIEYDQADLNRYLNDTDISLLIDKYINIYK